MMRDAGHVTRDTSHVTGFVLAGGRSSRMGRDKAFLPVGSRRMIELVIQRLRPSVERLAVLGSAVNIGRLRRLPVEAAFVDVRPHRGPLMGVYTGLLYTETPWNVFVSCDMPWIDGRLIERLMAASGGAFPMVAARHPLEGLQPFPLVCHASACRAVGALLDRGERSLQALLSGPGARLVRIEEPELWRSFTNVNTAADYHRVLRDQIDEAALAR